MLPAQIKPKSFESRRNFFFFFIPGVDVSHVYVRAWALGCFQSYLYPNLSEGADRVGGQLRGDKECPFSGVTKSGRVWRKVPESDARSVATSWIHGHTMPGGEVLLNVLRCQLTYQGQVVTNAEARFNNSLRPRKPEGSSGRTAQDVHLASHTAPELWHYVSLSI